MRLIDADRLKAEIMGWCVVTDDLFGMGKYHEREIVLQAIEESPTIDTVPVVRCQDCKYYCEYRTNKNKQIMRYCMRMAKNDMEYHVKPDDFCSYGERRETK
jgi:hypothetical protein